MKALVVLTTLPSAASAKKMARILVQNKLAACVSVQTNLESHYIWKGRLELSKECLLMIKIKASNYLRVERFIKKEHPYDLPEIIALPVIKGSTDYLRWINRK